MVHKKKVTIGMKKAHSLIKKILKMLDENKYCIDIIQQNLAVIGLLRSANLTLLEGHVSHCVMNAAKEKNCDKLEEMMEELLKVVQVAQKK
jgi:DNA-binding FrmR family transcriptional regulator